MTTKSRAGELYLKLIRDFPLRPLRSEDDLESAIVVIDALTDRKDLAPEEEEYLEVLSRLVEDYENEHDPLPEMSGVDALRYLLEENQLTEAQLSDETGISVATLSKVLNGKRAISPKVRAALSKRFKVAPTLFL